MDDFADVAKARASYKSFVEAMKAGREIMQRVGVPNPPPVPEFDVVFRRMSPEMRKELYAELNGSEATKPAEAIRVWQPMIRRAFGVKPRVKQ
ncbi:MAG TPA: hypothetical protein VKB79_10885 [Bryobacteraceae bacterium]|nr:hypothetical protein [Bryobacteraceae bacterium]